MYFVYSDFEKNALYVNIHSITKSACVANMISEVINAFIYIYLLQDLDKYRLSI